MMKSFQVSDYMLNLSCYRSKTGVLHKQTLININININNLTDLRPNKICASKVSQLRKYF
jgi:predicted component of type VI protein secretion system